MKYCDNCKSNLNENEKFCTNCGYEIKNKNIESNIDNSSSKEKINRVDKTNNIVNKKKKTINKEGIIVLIFFVITWKILNSLSPTNNILVSGFYGGIAGIIAYIVYIIFTTIFENK